MSLDLALEKFNAATYDPLLATVVQYGLVDIIYCQPARWQEEAVVFGGVAALLVIRNVFDYHRAQVYAKNS